MQGLEVLEAAMNDESELLTDLLATKTFDVNLRDPDSGFKSALHWAALRGSVQACEVLIDFGAKANIRMSNGFTPAHAAAAAGKSPTIKRLHKMKVTLLKKDLAGDTPREVALIFSNQETAQLIGELQEEERRMRERGEKFLDDDNEDIPNCQEYDQILATQMRQMKAEFEKTQAEHRRRICVERSEKRANDREQKLKLLKQKKLTSSKPINE